MLITTDWPVNLKGVLVDLDVGANIQIFVSQVVSWLSAVPWHTPSLEEFSTREAISGVLKNGDTVIRQEVADHKLTFAADKFMSTLVYFEAIPRFDGLRI